MGLGRIGVRSMEEVRDIKLPRFLNEGFVWRAGRKPK